MENELDDTIASLEKSLRTSRLIALQRIRSLGGSFQLSDGENGYEIEREITTGGLPSKLVSLLSLSFGSWQIFYKNITNSNDAPVNEVQKNGIIKFSTSNEIITLQRVVELLSKVSHLDPTLGEEIGRAGSQSILSQLLEQIKKCVSIVESEDGYGEEDFDALMDLQDAVCNIYSPRIRSMAFTDDELRGRLPLAYNLSPVNKCQYCGSAENDKKALNVADSTILISQVVKRQSAQADVGFVMWPSAIVLSRWILTNPQILYGKSVLELGAGCGLVGILAAELISKRNRATKSLGETKIEDECQSSSQVIITDINDLVLENIAHNIKLNGLENVASATKLDFYQQTGTNYSPGGWVGEDASISLQGEDAGTLHRKAVDVILAADIICQPEDAVAAAKTIHDALVPPEGTSSGVAYVVCADSEHRFGVEIFADECERIGLHVKSTKVANMYDGKLLSECMDSATGYVEGMELTFFEIVK